MALPVIVILTSQKCGHCINMRGDGKLKDSASGGPPSIKGGHRWNSQFMANLITGTDPASKKPRGPPKFRVFEINFPTLSPNNINQAAELSEFRFVVGGLQRISYKQTGAGMVTATVETGPVDGNLVNDANATAVVKAGLQGTKWDAFIKTRVPQELPRFFYLWPGWVYVRGSTWDQAIVGTAPLFAYVQSCFTKAMPMLDAKGEPVMSNGARKIQYAIDGKKQFTEALDPLVVAAKLNNTSSEFNPPALEEARPVQPKELVIQTMGPSCRMLGYDIVEG